MQPVPHPADRFLRWPEVRNLTGLSRSSIWRLMRNGRFPKSKLIGLRSTGWMQSEVEQWMANPVKYSQE